MGLGAPQPSPSPWTEDLGNDTRKPDNEVLALLRRWARARHVYGTRYGFPTSSHALIEGGVSVCPPIRAGGRPMIIPLPRKARGRDINVPR